MARRPPLKKQPSFNPFAADNDGKDAEESASASNPFAEPEDDDAVLDSASPSPSPAHKRRQQPPPAQHQTQHTKPKPKHTAPSFDDDDEDEQPAARRGGKRAAEEEQEVIDDKEEEEEEEESPVKKAWVPSASSMFARALPPSSSPKEKAPAAKPAPAKKAAAQASAPAATASAAASRAGGGSGKAKDTSNPFASHDDDTPPPAKAAPAAKKAADSSSSSNPFASNHSAAASSSSAAAKKADSNPFASSPAPVSSPPAAARGKADTKPVPAASASSPNAAASPPAAAASSSSASAKSVATAVFASKVLAASFASSSAAKPAHQRQDSNPFAEGFDEPDSKPAQAELQSRAPAAKPAAKPAAASASVSAPQSSPPASSSSSVLSPSKESKPAAAAKASTAASSSSSAKSGTQSSSTATPSASPVVTAAAPSSAKSTVSSVSSASTARTPQSVPSPLRIESEEAMEAVDLSAPLSPASVKRDAAYRRKMQQAVQAAGRIELSAFNNDFDAKLFTASLTAPLFELTRERWPVEADEEEALREAEEAEEEEEGDAGDWEGDAEDGELSKEEKQRRKREQQLEREAAGPRLRRRPFDPEPFGSLFSLALSRLDTLRDGLDASISSGNAVTQRAEAEHTKKMAAFTSSLSSLTARFHRLDRRISSVSHTAVRIGSTLDAINTSKQNSLRAYELLSHFIAFNTGDPSRLSPLFSAASSSRLQDMYAAAETIQTLEAVSAEVRVAGTEKAVGLIARISEECESRLLARFEEAMEKGGPAAVEEMKGMAKVLLGFRGKNIIKRYVFAAIQQMDNNSRKALALAQQQDDAGHDDDDEDEDEEGEDHAATAVAAQRMTADSAASPVVSAFRSSMRVYYRSILSTLRSQCRLCSAVFPSPSSIIRAIVERVFSDKVAEFIDAAIGKPGVGGEQELLMLTVAQQQTARLTQQLQQLIKTLPSASLSSASLSSSSAASFDPSTLTDMMNGVFQRYRDAYAAKETAVLRARCMQLIQATLESQAAHDANASSASASPAQDDSSSDYFGFKRRAALLSNKQRWIIGVLENETVDTVLQTLLVSMQRCDTLSDSAALGDNAAAIFGVVLSCLIDDFVAPLYAQIVPFIPAADPKTEPDAFYFLCVRLLSSIADRLRQHYTYFILPRRAAHTNAQAVCEQRMRELLSTVETELLSGLNRCLNAQLRFMQRQLSKQKPSDYRPKDEEALFSGRPTAACSALVDCMHHAYHCVVSNMEGRNTDQYLSVLGLRCYELLVEHLQRLTVSELGAGLLSRDCKEYEAMVLGWHIGVVLDRFGLLRTVSNLFFVSVDNLAAWVQQEPRVRTMDKDDLLRFIRMRHDYTLHKAKIHSMLNV